MILVTRENNLFSFVHCLWCEADMLRRIVYKGEKYLAVTFDNYAIVYQCNRQNYEDEFMVIDNYEWEFD